MNIILLNSKRGHSRTLSVPRHLPVILLAVLMVVPVLVGVGAYWVSYRWAPPSYTDAVAAASRTIWTPRPTKSPS